MHSAGDVDTLWSVVLLVEGGGGREGKLDAEKRTAYAHPALRSLIAGESKIVGLSLGGKRRPE